MSITGYTDFSRTPDGKLFATASYEDGHTERVSVRVSVEREHRRADGSLAASGEVASTDDDSVKIPDGAVL